MSISTRNKKTILFLAANPKNTTPVDLQKEAKEIAEGLQRSKKRDKFQLEQQWAVTPREMQRAVLDYKPEIVHFSGHGAGEGGLALEDEAGQIKLVNTKALAALFEAFKEYVECVILNACYSEVQAEAIARHIPYVIGMNQAVGDRAAREFAVGFYDALAAGESIERAYKLGCVSISMAGIPEQLTPVLKKKSDVSELDAGDRSRDASGSDTVEESSPAVENRRSIAAPPLSLLNLDNPEGSVSLDSPLYIDRPPIESDCYQTIVKAGALIRIKAPRQMGKTSLVQRILYRAKEQGYQTAYLNFQWADGSFLTNLDELLQWFCGEITNELNLEDRLGEYWKGILGSKNKSTKYFQRYLLSNSDRPVVLGLDEVDRIFPHSEIATDFFGLLRAWHERGKNEEIWKKLRLVISHSQEVYIPLNINQSPFNVGLPVELPELNQKQVTDLVNRHRLNLSNQEICDLMEMVGGHPYLVRVALYQIARGRITLDSLLKVAPTEEGPYYDHLRRHLVNLETDAELAATIRQVINSEQPVEIHTREAFKLRSMGLIKFQGNAVMPLCGLYCQYFRHRLASPRANMTAVQQTNNPSSLQSHLAAIMFSDVVNSTALSVANQKLTLELVNRDFNIIRGICAKHQGKVLKEMGDGLLICFPESAVKAVACALEIQRSLAESATTLPPSHVLQHRIGIHLGEIFYFEEDIRGAGVNLAARLEGKAEPGGICISETVYQVVKTHLSLNVIDLGMQHLKGIPEPVRLYKLIP
ncbi:adenylate/guanylate cyclase [Oscillatoria nigro-viridis PCC 7112]|uniref:Adenylate/guanylate cyclase n=1 Tax=Phormidium nigroviride PCC 7112 TaxID=179408 RepID=K9VI78_9CYAN|nr:AAA-like domain-containing protein [Oscillatoria nigro-viridis]AFZ07219.1 adenylate/guanylate cyclase [Oscillatoria nigro-viridis PCC 7112]